VVVAATGLLIGDLVTAAGRATVLLLRTTRDSAPLAAVHQASPPSVSHTRVPRAILLCVNMGFSCLANRIFACELIPEATCCQTTRTSSERIVEQRFIAIATALPGNVCRMYFGYRDARDKAKSAVCVNFSGYTALAAHV
jgi:hypothetical protein